MKSTAIAVFIFDQRLARSGAGRHHRNMGAEAMTFSDAIFAGVLLGVVGTVALCRIAAGKLMILPSAIMGVCVLVVVFLAGRLLQATAASDVEGADDARLLMEAITTAETQSVILAGAGGMMLLGLVILAAANRGA